MKKLFALLLLASLPAAADPVEISLYCFQQAAGLGSVRVPSSGGSSQEVQLSTANIVGPLRAESTDGFLTLSSPLATDGSSRPTGRVKLPGDRVLIVLVPAPAGAPLPYHCFAIERTDVGFPLGSYQVINLSPFDVRGAIGRTYVEARSAGIVPFKPEGKPGSTLGARFEFQEGGIWKLLTETRCAIRDDRRWLLFAYRDPRSERMNLRCVPDRSKEALVGLSD